MEGMKMSNEEKKISKALAKRRKTCRQPVALRQPLPADAEAPVENASETSLPQGVRTRGQDAGPARARRPDSPQPAQGTGQETAGAERPAPPHQGNLQCQGRNVEGHRRRPKNLQPASTSGGGSALCAAPSGTPAARGGGPGSLHNGLTPRQGLSSSVTRIMTQPSERAHQFR